jgi:hypothetical protein
MIKIREFTEMDRPELQHIYLRSRQQTFYWLNTALFVLTDFDKDTAGEEILVAEDERDLAPCGGLIILSIICMYTRSF